MSKHLDTIKQGIEAYCAENFNFEFNPENPVIRLHEPTFSHEEVFAATQQMLSTYVTMGKQVRTFEEQYAEKFGHKYAVTNNSGSSANLLAVSLLSNPKTENHLKPGDEVIVPALSWSTTVWPIIQHGLVPVFVDCDPKTFNMTAKHIEEAITPKTRAIKLVHVYGNPCDMEEIMAVAKKHNLFVIEDSCESMGAKFKNQYVGSFGDIGTLSFFFSHHITTLEGGICTTNSFEMAENLRILRAHGWSREADEKQKYIDMYPDIDPRFIFVNLGYNLRITEVQAVIGQQQLVKFDSIVSKRRENVDTYKKLLSEYEDIFDFQHATRESEPTWFGCNFILKENVNFGLKDITSFIQSNKIETRPIIAGNMAKHPALTMFQHKLVGDMTNANRIMARGFSLGCHQAVTEAGCEYVANVIKTFIKNNYVSAHKNTAETVA